MSGFFALALATSFSNISPTGQYKVDQHHSVDFVNEYTYDTNNFENFMYSTGTDANHTLFSSANLTLCEETCAFNHRCRGIYYDYQTCNNLNNLGYPLQTETPSTSIRKIEYKNYDYRNNTIRGYNYNLGLLEENTTIYIDLNNNNVMDEGEPRTTAVGNDYFYFNNLMPGAYVVRSISPQGCVNFYPGIRGTGQWYYGTGYADVVTNYYDDGHGIHHGLKGGLINSTNSSYNVTFDFILKNNTNTYLSFYDNYNITLGLTDETIRDLPGDDIFVTTYLNSSINAHVSVSSDGFNYSYLGILSDNKTSFDLGLINYTLPINHIRFHFFHNNLTVSDTPRNIVMVRGQIDKSFSPPYAQLIEVPTTYTMLFINDCEYYFNCYTYCYYGIYEFEDIDSCDVGCNYYRDYRNCNNCSDTHCYDGCEYRLKQSVFPKYSVLSDSRGFDPNLIEGFSCEGCIDDIVRNCNNITDCYGITLDGDQIRMFNSFDHIYNSRSYFLIKNDLLGDQDLSYMTTTPTSTVTSTLTSSATSTLTSSATSTLTSSVTSTLTSSATSTLTSSVTSTDTSTQTTSPTTTTTLLDNNNPERSDEITRNIVIITLSVIVFLALVAAFVYAYKHSINRSSVNNVPPSHNSFSNPVYDVGGNYIDPDMEADPVGINGYMDIPEPSDPEQHRNIDDNYLYIDHNSQATSNL